MLKKLDIIKLIKFGCVGALGSGILLGITYALTDKIGLYYLASYIVGFITSVIANYFLNTLWTFSLSLQWFSFLKYLILSCISIGINSGVVYALTDMLKVWYIASSAIAILTGFTINYLASRRLVWAERKA